MTDKTQKLLLGLIHKKCLCTSLGFDHSKVYCVASLSCPIKA